MKRGPLHVHIEELVLEGFEPSQRHQIADAVERELARLLKTVELRDGLEATRIGRRDAGSFLVDARGPSALGQQVAQAVGSTVTGVLGASGNSGNEARTR